jgi:predicted NUDIX family NTP pyrophosphohydrolase
MRLLPKYIMPKTSAGILLFKRRKDDVLRVFLVHPGGPFFANRDEGAWSVPKGEPGPGEEAFAAARREFEEETGCGLEGTFVPLSPITQRGGKIVLAWALEGDCDAEAVRSNTFALEWPPHSGRVRDFPEVDRAGWFTVDEARKKMNPAQVALVDELVGKLTR